jgi:hypothetical protein
MPTINDKAVMACYTMEPEGLQFSSPVSVNMTLPFAGNTTPIPLLFSRYHGVSLLEDVQVIPGKSGSSINIVGKISHFSDLIINRQGLFTLSVTNPSNALAALPVDLRATVTINPDFKNMVVKKKAVAGENIVTYWVAFRSFRYDCYISEQGTTNRMSPHEVRVSGPEINLETLYSAQQIPITARLNASPSPGTVALNYRLVTELTTESRSDKFGAPVIKNTIYTPELSYSFSTKKPWSKGRFLLSTSVISDPSDYAHSILLAAVLTCSVTDSGSQITIVGNGNWVTVRGQIRSDGKFTLTGKGIVAGSGDTSVELNGRFTGDMMFEGEYSMGSGGIRVIYKVTARGETSSGLQVSNYPLFSSGGFLSFFESVGWIRSGGPRDIRTVSSC